MFYYIFYYNDEANNFWHNFLDPNPFIGVPWSEKGNELWVK